MSLSRHAVTVVTGTLLLGGLTAPASQAVAAGACLGQQPTIVATRNFVEVAGTAGPDVIDVTAFPQVEVVPGSGDDLICGGPGTRISYADEPSGVTIHVRAGTATGPSTGTDRFEGVHRFYGSVTGADVFHGSAETDDFNGGKSYDDAPPQDVVWGHGGNDVLQAYDSLVWGGPGNDAIHAESGRIDGGPGDDHLGQLSGGIVLGGPGHDDIRMSMDAVEYHHYGPNVYDIRGGAGRDRIYLRRPAHEGTVYGCAQCDFTLAGNGGHDVLDLSELEPEGDEPAADEWSTRVLVRVDLEAGTARAQDLRVAVSSFEEVEGSRYRDVLLGTRHADHLDGNLGNDVLRGRGGPDLLHGKGDRDVAYGGPGRDRCDAEVRHSC